jgi:uncharacterized protein
LWHYPLIIPGYEHYQNVAASLLVFPVNTILLSIIFGWLRLKTLSIWASSIAHGATNSFGASVTLLLFAGGPNFILVGYLGILSWIPLGALCLWILLTKQLNTYSGDTGDPGIGVLVRGRPSDLRVISAKRAGKLCIQMAS